MVESGSEPRSAPPASRRLKLDAHASRVHYLRHLLSVFAALPADRQGTLTTSTSGARDLVRREGVPGRIGRPRGAGSPVLVSSYVDAQTCRQRRRIVVEHGAGQSYPGCAQVAQSGSYAGGTGHEGTLLFLGPSEAVAARWRARYPASETATIGAPPYLDPWLRRERPLGEGRALVAVSFHWDGARLCPELGSALEHFAPALRALAADFHVIGHGHPRIASRLAHVWRALDVEFVRDLSDVLDRADVLVADNSSTLYEFAATGRPVLALDAPTWRREVSHGLRFWSHVPGLSCSEPSRLSDAVEEAVNDPSLAQEMRERAVSHAYHRVDGRSTERAVRAIVERLEGLDG